MATARQFEHEDVATVPRGWRVRSVTHSDGTIVRIAYPPGPRKKGSGKLISILHPKANPKTKTREQVEAMQAKAVRFLEDVAGDSDKADEIEGLSVEEYAARKHITISNPKKGKRRNPNEIDQAAERFKEFHGELPKEVVDVQEKEIARDTYSGLGYLYEMRCAKNAAEPFTLDFHGLGVVLARSVEGHQLYIVGGDQDCDSILKGEDQGKDFVNVGIIRRISYVTRKDFDKFKESIYEHKFGEEGGDLPWLLYNRLQKRLFIVGGDYTIAKPGIIN
jgi:hypothetical protein